jgi:hypothetical protein
MKTPLSIKSQSTLSLSPRLWKTHPLRAFLPLLAVFAAVLFSTWAAQGQATNRYTRVASQLVDLINAGDYADIQTNFNQEMGAALPLDKSSAFFLGLTQHLGKLQKLGEPHPAGEWMVFPAKFDKGTIDLQLALDGRGQIAGLVFKPQATVKAGLRYTNMAYQLMKLINAGDYAGLQAKFNKDMDAALPLDKSSEFFKGLMQQMGKIQVLGKPQLAGEGMDFPGEFEKGAFDMQLVLDGSGLIAGLTFTPHEAR